MNLNAPEYQPLAAWCISAMVAGLEIGYTDVPKQFQCSEDLFEVLMEEIFFQFENGHPSTVH